ncbi:MAG: DedA family protein [Planctomycetia bacterium]|nr:MAG: DedA family protein [Planctomycetia bacterium]
MDPRSAASDPPLPAAGAAPPKRRAGIHRRMYDWVLHWAATPYGVAALFLIALVESSVFPIPPDVLLIAMVLSARTRWLWFATVCTVGSVLGGLLGYLIGMTLMDTVGQAIIRFYHAEKYYATVEEWYKQYDYWIVFIAAFSPIPYKVFTIASGAFHMNVLGFAGVSLVGRGARFILVAFLLYLLGEPVKRFIDRYFDLLAILFVVLLVGGFVILKVL